MVSKTSLSESVRAHRWREVGDGLAARPDLLQATDEKGRNWLHHCCRSPLGDRDPADGIRLETPAFTEGEWRATPLWFAISWGRNLPLAAHLLRLGSTPLYCLFAAIWNEDRAAIRLLLEHNAPVDEAICGGE